MALRKTKTYAASVKSPAIEHQDAVSAVYDEEDNLITPAKPETLARAAIYMDEDIKGATDF